MNDEKRGSEEQKEKEGYNSVSVEDKCTYALCMIELLFYWQTIDTELKRKIDNIILLGID